MTSLRQLPLWVRYVVAFAVGATLFVALVIYVRHHQGALSESPAAPDAAQAAQQQQQDRTLVAQQQAPHDARASGVGPRAAAAAAVFGYMGGQVNGAFITGPIVGTARCRPAGAADAFSCTVTSGPASARLNYPFDVTVQPRARTVRFCQVITSPDPSVPSPPVSALCR